MSQELFEELMRSVMQGMTLELLELATGDGGGKGFQTCRSGGLTHLRVTNTEGEVFFQVSGKDIGELAWQLVLACLHKISIEKLRTMHKRPLKRPLQMKKVKG